MDCCGEPQNRPDRLASSFSRHKTPDCGRSRGLPARIALVRRNDRSCAQSLTPPPTLRCAESSAFGAYQSEGCDPVAGCGSAIPRRISPGLCQSFRPKEGVGNAGCPVHPQPRVRKWWLECTRVFTASSPETPGIPTQWFTAYTALSLATGLSCHHRRRITPPT